jgi:hypothetical protein
MWKIGDMLRHRFDPGAGPGRVTALEGRSVLVHFPSSDATLRFAAASDALAPYEMPPGTTARLLPAGELVRIEGAKGRATGWRTAGWRGPRSSGPKMRRTSRSSVSRGARSMPSRRSRTGWTRCT